ncbi:Holliday junction branch migration protein RuvA [Eubacteriales bacterium OttesenSCG-928-N13]|nr:Holliday junction branch migration protein RuvA [Eubacteriales bacterium OttesenSCG-928-N13]
MYAHIDGILSEKSADALVIDCGGVGYLLQVSGQTLSHAPSVGERMKCYTVLSVREDAMELFGFYAKEEKVMYEKLRSVSGIGPRTALGILSALSIRDLSIALVTGDAGALARAPGVGKKTAQRLVLELRDKVENQELVGADAAYTPAMSPTDGAAGEAIEALMALGYASSEAAKAVSKVAGQSDNSGELIRLALKGMGS